MSGPAPAGPAHILLVDDDATVTEVLTRYLEREGFAVDSAADGDTALERARADPPDLVVLDLMLPGIDGLEVCRRLRQDAPVPVVMLTARGDESDRIAGLELGADDYVVKPFSPRELTARVKAVLRRAQGPLPADAGLAGADPVLRAGNLVVDTSARQVHLGGREVALTAREFELLTFLLRHPRRAFRREELFEQVWGWTYGDTATVTVHVRRLREKIEANPAEPAFIVTVWGVGYRFEPGAETAVE
ncbi:MAG: response regulator transcription factor [Acidimicrobiales bacterium]